MQDPFPLKESEFNKGGTARNGNNGIEKWRFHV